MTHVSKKIKLEISENEKGLFFHEFTILFY